MSMKDQQLETKLTEIDRLSSAAKALKAQLEALARAEEERDEGNDTAIVLSDAAYAIGDALEVLMDISHRVYCEWYREITK